MYVTSELDRETVEEITLTVFVEDLNAEVPSKQNDTGKQITKYSDRRLIGSSTTSHKVDVSGQIGMENPTINIFLLLVRLPCNWGFAYLAYY